MKDIAGPVLSQLYQGRDASALRFPQGLTVFCDFDGPLVDVSDRYYSTYQLGLDNLERDYAARGLYLPIHRLTKDQFWQMKCDRIPDMEIAMRSGLRDQQITEFLQQVQHIVNGSELLAQDTLQPGVRWALSLLRSLGINLVLVTLRCQTQATQILDEFGLLHLFSDVYGTRDYQSAYRNAAEQKVALLQTAIANHSTVPSSPDTAWMIGDTEADVLAGQAAGIATIALTCGIRSRSYLERFTPTHIHSDLLSAAHYLLCRCETMAAVN